MRTKQTQYAIRNTQYAFTPLEIKRDHRSNYKFLTGFTLIELLVSISIFAIIAVVLYSSFRGGVVSWRRIDTELALQQKIRYTFDKMSKDFRNMVFLSNLPFEGSADELKFVSLVKLAAQEDLGLTRVSYYLSFDEQELSEGTIVRKEEPIKNALSLETAELEGSQEELIETEATGIEGQSKQSGKRQSLLDGISELKFSYLATYKETDKDEEAEYQWLDFWEDKETLPAGIKIEFTLTNPEDSSSIILSKRIYIPIGKPTEKPAVPAKD